jgi:transcription antitermination factor NusG
MTTSPLLPIPTSRNLEWFAVHTWARHEKSVFQQLCSKEVKAFLPLYQPSKRWRNGQVSDPLPLFPGYLFVHIDIREQLPVLQTSGVARFIGFAGKAVALPEDEIAKLEAVVTNGVVAVPHPFLTVGDRVLIKNGPLAGLNGMLVRDKHSLRVVLSVELISRSISVELNATDVEPLLENVSLGRSLAERMPDKRVSQCGSSGLQAKSKI